MSDFAVMPIADYVGACDSIREKTGENAVIKSGELAEEIGKVYTAGQSSMVDPTKIIEKTASGIGSVTVDDVSEIPHEISVTLANNNLIPYPYHNTTITKNGVTFTDNGDGSITLNGKSTTDMSFTFFYDIREQYRGTYTLSTKNPLPLGSRIILTTVSGGSNRLTGDGLKTSTTFDIDDTALHLWLWTGTNTVFDNLTIYPKLELGSIATNYITDFSGVSISKLGSNLFGGSAMADKMVELNSSVTREDNTVHYTASAFHNKEIINGIFKENTQYTIMLFGTQSNSTSYLNINLLYTDGTTREIYTTTGAFTTLANKTVQALIGCWKSGSVTMNCDECGIFEGDVLNREFEPYITPTVYKPNADGTVEGVTSLSPYMTLQSDIEGVNISMTYHKSWGMQTEYDRFWRKYLPEDGEQMNYLFVGRSWNDRTYKPPRTPKPWSHTKCLFMECGLTAITLDTVDMSEQVASESYFAGSVVQTIEINTPKCESYNLTFARCGQVKRIVIHNILEKATFNNTFQNCYALEDVQVDGVIGNNISFAQSSVLSKNSTINIFSVLSDTATSKTLTLKLSAVNTAFETSEGAADGSTSEEWLNLVATKPNWTISLA